MDYKDDCLSLNTEERSLIRCYFCGEIFSDKLLQSHISQCQSILEKCPQNCGVYITRKERNFHIKKNCPETKVNDLLPAKNIQKNDCRYCEYCCKNMEEIESEIKIIQLRIDDERRNRLQFEYTWLNELSKLHERYKKNEEWQENIFTILSTIQKNTQREEQIHSKEISKINYKFDRISSVLQNVEMCINDLNNITKETKNDCLTKNEELLEWRSKQDNRLASLRNLNEEYEKLREDHLSKSRSMLNLLDLNEVIIENQEQCSEQVKIHDKDIESLKEVLNEENNLISNTWKEQLKQLKYFKEEFQKTEDILSQLLKWQKHVKKKIAKFDKNVNSEFNELIPDDYNNLVTLCTTDIPIYSNGHLLWCILDFEEQLEESKLANIVLQSPTFYTSEYGYKLQMRVHPNGLGQWKGRHMIISVHVVNSEWDSLLKWPIKMNTTVLMRDQTSDCEKAKDLIKCFGNNVIMKDNESSKTIQMFIPHRLLRQNSYINKNSIILEAQVQIIND